MASQKPAAFEEAHGVKRRADDNLENEQRLAKRFTLLNLDKNRTLGGPPPRHDFSTANSQSNVHPRRSKQQEREDHMQVEDTKDRIYIYDLDEELADVASSSDDEKIFFIPDIERRLNNVPKHLLAGNPPPQNALVLYGVPRSLSVPEEHDSVRKAILETRTRARQEMAGADANKHPEALSEAVWRTKSSSYRRQPVLTHDWRGMSDQNGSYEESGGDAMDIG